MKSRNSAVGTVAWLAGALAISVAAPPAEAQRSAAEGPVAEAEEQVGSSSSRLIGELPARLPRITVKLVEATVPEALQAVCAQARLGLVFVVGEAAASKRITLSLKKHQAAEVLELILDAGELDAEIRGGVLYVTSSAASPAESASSPKPEPGEEPVAEGGTPEEPAGDGAAAPPAEGVEIPIKIETDDGDVEVMAKLKGSKDDRVQIGKSLRIEAGEVVKDVVVMGGSLAVAGHVRGDVAVIGGSVTVEPGAVVDGDVAAMGGAIDVQPGAVVHGDKAGLGGPVGEVIGGLALSSISHRDTGTRLLFDVLTNLLRAAILFVLALLFVSFMPERHARVRGYMLQRPGYSVLAGVIMALAIAPVCVLFAVTVIGIPLIPVMFLFLLALMVVGLSAFLTWLGEKIPIFKDRKSPVGALAIGVALFFVVSLVPVAGSIIIGAVAFFSAGASLLSRFGSEPRPKTEPATVAP